MTLSEASRQYQAALEHRRTARTQVAGSVSFESELAELDREVSQAQAVLDRAWLTQAG